MKFKSHNQRKAVWASIKQRIDTPIRPQRVYAKQNKGEPFFRTGEYIRGTPYFHMKRLRGEYIVEGYDKVYVFKKQEDAELFMDRRMIRK